MNKNYLYVIIGALFCLIGIVNHSSGNKTIGYVFAILAIIILFFGYVSMLKQKKNQS